MTEVDVAVNGTRERGRPAEEERLIGVLSQAMAELARTVARQPAKVSVRVGDTAFEAEWPADTGGTGAAAPAPAAAAHAHSEQQGQDGAEPAITVDASLVGTFYRSAEPGAPPFVEVGDEVQPGMQLAIIEAMKLMIPVEADRAGTVVGVLAADGAPVEFDQPLFALAAEDDT
ncbi:acetyl-CoA carboxylase biotin carboxyl carrier protein [Streptomonospora algeriensis]|uniref:Biotin carboxyl carrier protein of acetyl-CoA carboxylase n=1 Tax=Streptomonospora algeriensis TaxID=995084 RepID=A0ABW3BAG8_9ACTN